MHTLWEAFQLATIAGIWSPFESVVAKLFYNIYSLMNTLMAVGLCSVQIIAGLKFAKDINDFAEASYLSLETFNGLLKGLTMLIRHRQIKKLLDNFLDDDFQAQNDGEKFIIQKYSRRARYLVIYYTSFVGVSVSFSGALPVFFTSKYTLQVMAWFPYDTNNDLGFWTSYIFIMLSMCVTAAWNVTLDTLIAGLMVQTCAQLDLVAYRLKTLTETENVDSNEIIECEKLIIKKCARHHKKVFKFAKDIQYVFAPAILSQFCLCVIIICISIFKLTSKDTELVSVPPMLIFVISMLVELFFYCWFGNEVILKSVSFNQNICKIEWTKLQVQTMKKLLFMMTRATSPIILKCGPFIILSLDSYKSILKLSYSAFNILRRSA